MPYLASGMDRKNEVFQRLKPAAVELSQALLTINNSPKDTKLIEDRLHTLHATLSSIIATGGVFDQKLADYVFFPISQVLKLSQSVSLQCLESSLAIISILIRRGWGPHIQHALAQQLLLLCTLLAGDNPAIASTDHTTPELQRNAIKCLEELFIVLGGSPSATALLSSDTHLPQLGHTISTLLQALHKPASPAVQESAIKTLQALFAVELPPQVLLNFLPGVVSSLTKLLTIQSGQRRRPELLISSLEILNHLFRSVFKDKDAKTTTDLQAVPSVVAQQPENGSDGEQYADNPLEIAAVQIRLALISIVRLRDHDRNDLKSALGRLCMTILRHCRKTLSNCTQLALETILALSARSNVAEMRFEVVMLMTTDPAILHTVKSTIFDWSQSLVRVMQAANDDAKSQRLEQIGSAYQCLVDAGVDLTTTTQLLIEVVKDCVVLILQANGDSRACNSTLSTVKALQVANSDHEMAQMEKFTAITTTTSQTAIARGVQDLVELMSTIDTSFSIMDAMIHTLTTSREQNLVASLWLSLHAARISMTRSDDLDTFIDAGEEKMMLLERVEELYSFALSYLISPVDEQIPSATSLALQTLALRAQLAGVEFKVELIDALYPVLHSLATSHQAIQHDSMVALNIFAKACGYKSVADLIVDNVDYLTNAVALKLNSFDVSPQAPQVLLMMVRLAGPSLVPYLEDIIESIFAALEDYHGHPLLVELLFQTLAVVAHEGSKAPLLAAHNDAALMLVHGGSARWEPVSLMALAQSIHDRVETRESSEHLSSAEPAPQQPWGPIDNEESTEELQPLAEEDQGPPAPKTYHILVKITELTQHFLPSASPTLRTSLLSLIRTTVPAIARHENTFLPLINTLWPEIVSRLEDEESSNRVAALNVIAKLCEHGKDFMRSRVSDMWPQMREIWRDVVKDIMQSSSTARPKQKPSTAYALVRLENHAKREIQRMQSAPTDYSNVSARTMWQAFVQLLTVVVRSVPVSPEIFDEALEMVASELDDHEVLAAFEQENADALWLARLKQGQEKISWTPTFG